MKKTTRKIDVLISSFELTDEELEYITAIVGVGLMFIHKTDFMPVIIKNGYDDFFGKNNTVSFKYYE